MPAAVLTIDINARLASLEKAFNDASRKAGLFSTTMQSAAKAASAALAGVGVGLVTTKLVDMVRSSIDAADHLNDLSKKTGISVEALGGLGLSAKQSGTDLDGVAKAVGKLNLQIASASAGNEEARQAFKLLGISLAELKTSSPDQVLARIADQFASYEDGPQKAALANRLFGKSYQDIIPLLDEGGKKLQENSAYFQKYGGITAEIAAKSDQFNDTLTKINLLQGSFSRNLTAALLPQLQVLATAWVEQKEKGDGFAETAKQIAAGFQILASGAAIGIFAIKGVGKEIATLLAQAQILANTDVFDIKTGLAKFKAVGDAAGEEAKAAQKSLKDLLAGLSNPLGTIGGAFDPRLDTTAPKRKRPAPDLPKTAAGGDDPSRKILEGQLRVLERNSALERDILSARADYLHDYYAEGVISINDYYSKLQEARDTALDAEVKNLDREIALAEAHKRIAKTPADRESDQNKIEGFQDRQTKILRDAENVRQAAARAESRDREKQIDQLGELNAKILELAGNTAKASGIRFDIQNRVFDTSLKSAPQTDEIIKARAQEASLRAITEAQSGLNDVTRVYFRQLDGLSILQDRISLDQDKGALTEIGALNKRADLARAFIPLLDQQIEKYRAIAANTELPAAIREDALLQVQRMTLEVDKLAASADALTNKFRDIGVSSFTTFLDDLVSRTKSFKDAVKDLERSIVSSIANIANKNLAEAIFGEKGALGKEGLNLAGRLSGLFGDKGGAGKGIASSAATAAAGGVGIDATITALGASAGVADPLIAGLGTAAAATALQFTPLEAGFIAVAAAAEKAAASLLAVGSGSGVSGLSSLFSGGGADLGSGFGDIPAFAKGTSFVPKTTLALVHKGEAIIPAELNRKVPSFDVGTPYVTKTMLALVHKGEAIVPAAQNRQGSSQGSRVANGGKVITLNAPITINMPGGTSRASADQAGSLVYDHLIRSAKRVG